MPAEQPETLPAASVALALIVIVWLSSRPDVFTLNVPPTEEPVPIGAPPQLAWPYTLIVAPASAAPETVGLLLFAGEVGEVDSDVGAVGAMLSCVYEKPVEQPETLFAASVALA